MDASNTNSNTFIPPSASASQSSQDPSNRSKKKKINKKTIVLFGLILFMLASIGLGLSLIRQQQVAQGRAAAGKEPTGKEPGGKAPACTLGDPNQGGGWVTTACGPSGAGAPDDGAHFHYQRRNCKDCRAGGFTGNIDPRLGPLGKYPSGGGVVRYKCPRTQANKADPVVMDWYNQGCNVGVPGFGSAEPGVGSVDENFCGMQQIDKNGTFFSYWNLTNGACQAAYSQAAYYSQATYYSQSAYAVPSPTVITPTVITPTVITPTVITPTVITPTVITPTTITPTVTGPTLTPTNGPSATPTEVILAKSTPTSPVTQAPTIPSAGSQAGVFFMVTAGLILMTLLFVF